MRHFPEMRQVPGRHRAIAADHFAVDLQCSCGVAEYFLGVLIVVGDDVLCRRRPQIRQQPGIAGGDARADFAFERERVLAQPLARDAARRDIQQYFVHDVR